MDDSTKHNKGWPDGYGFKELDEKYKNRAPHHYPFHPAHKSTTRNRRSSSQRKRDAITRRDGPNCYYCQNPTIEGSDRTLEHLQPKSLGGSNNQANLVLAHWLCNQFVTNLPKWRKEAIRRHLIEHGEWPIL